MTRFNRQKWGLSRLPDAMDEAVCQQMRVVIASTDKQIVSRIREAFAECEDVAGVVVASDSIEAAQLTASTRPDVVVVDQAFDGDGLHLCGVLDRIAPHTKVILLVSGVNEETVITAARAGARDVLSQSFEPHEFVEAVGRLTAEEMKRVGQDYELALHPEAFPRVVVVASCKGGTGTSAIAGNVAEHFGGSMTGKTILLDGSPMFSATSTMFDTVLRRGLADIVPHWETPSDLGLDPDLVHERFSEQIPGHGFVGGEQHVGAGIVMHHAVEYDVLVEILVQLRKLGKRPGRRYRHYVAHVSELAVGIPNRHGARVSARQHDAQVGCQSGFPHAALGAADGDQSRTPAGIGRHDVFVRLRRIFQGLEFVENVEQLLGRFGPGPEVSVGAGSDRRWPIGLSRNCSRDSPPCGA